MHDVFIRPLEEADGLISWKWRNDEEIWRLTGGCPPGPVTPEIELNWYRSTLPDPTKRRFAICLTDNDEYIGNIQLTSVTAHDAEYHIFIGEKQYWGQGIAKKASRLLFEIAKKKYNLQRIYLYVTPANKAATKVYEQLGFVKKSDEIKMELNLP